MRLLTDEETKKLFQIYLLERDNFPKHSKNPRCRRADKYSQKQNRGLIGCLDGEEIAKMKLTKRQKLALKARDKLILHNQGLIHKYAEKYTSYTHMYPDLLSYGMLGLIRAVDTFEPKYNCLLSTHATWLIRQQLYHAVVNHLRLVKLDSDCTEDIRTVTKAVEKCRKSNKKITVSNICGELTNEGLVDKSELYDRVQRILLVSQEPLYFSMGNSDSEEDNYELDPPYIDDPQTTIPFEYTELAKERLYAVTKDKESWCYDFLCDYYGLKYGYKRNIQDLIEEYNIEPYQACDLINATVNSMDVAEIFSIKTEK